LHNGVVIQFGFVDASPNATHDVPTERTVMRFVLVTTYIFEIMPYRRINVAVSGDALLPVVLTILLAPFFKMLGNFKEHG
jgi:hypothetical protein